jgi:hypothetical protein
MKLYYLCRKEDVSGMSGIGHIAEVAEFDDGSVVVRWIASMNAAHINSTTIFNSMSDLLRIHGHGGRTIVELVADSDHVVRIENHCEELKDLLRRALGQLEEHGLSLPGGIPPGIDLSPRKVLADCAKHLHSD